MIFIHFFPGLHTPQNLLGQEILHDPHNSLQDDADVGDQTQDAVGGCKAGMVAFVDFDDDESGEEGENAEGLESVVDFRSLAFLGGC